jgi:hypothetical protein
MKEAAACFCIYRLIGRFSVYIWRAVTGVVFTAPQINLRALFCTVSRWNMLAILVISITTALLHYRFNIGVVGDV